jgi:Zn-dependent peptidase ImmA (M78 family)
LARSPAASTRLNAAASAKRLHRQLGLEARIRQSGGSVDVFEIIAELDIPLLFKPLETAQGLCLPKPLRGIMITTRRTLSIQRFTAAHELGHLMLDHEASIDLEILERGPLGPDKGRDLQEVAADAFAAEFMLPRWLYGYHIQRQGWSVAELRNPNVTYQLALRMGASYEATCWGLLSHQILKRPEVDALRKEKVANMKTRLGDGFRPADSWADVWRFTERDDGGVIGSTERDLVRLELPENSSAGYEWDVGILRDAGLEILDDRSEFNEDPIIYGAPAKRRVMARPLASDRRMVSLIESQPWSPGNDSRLTVTLNFDGAETGGLSKAERRRMGAMPA